MSMQNPDNMCVLKMTPSTGALSCIVYKECRSQDFPCCRSKTSTPSLVILCGGVSGSLGPLLGGCALLWPPVSCCHALLLSRVKWSFKVEKIFNVMYSGVHMPGMGGMAWVGQHMDIKCLSTHVTHLESGKKYRWWNLQCEEKQCSICKTPSIKK